MCIYFFDIDIVKSYQKHEQGTPVLLEGKDKSS